MELKVPAKTLKKIEPLVEPKIDVSKDTRLNEKAKELKIVKDLQEKEVKEKEVKEKEGKEEKEVRKEKEEEVKEEDYLFGWFHPCSSIHLLYSCLFIHANSMPMLPI